MNTSYRILIYHAQIKHISICVFLFIITVFTSCRKFIEIDPPRTELIAETVFNNDASAEAAVVDVYRKMAKGGNFATGNPSGFSFGAGITSDELVYLQADPNQQQLFDNEIAPSNFYITGYWTDLYSNIYSINAILESLSASTTLTPELKLKLEGESKFLRAFNFFYLVNLFGDVPLVLSSDYLVNKSVTRTPSEDVYKQIIEDLKEAQNLLPNSYTSYDNLRIRVTKGAATALLSRTYLYTGNWNAAETEATALIEDSTYRLEPDLTNIFTRTSTEAIFQLWDKSNPREVLTYFFIIAAGGLRSEIMNSFETNDLRASTWIFPFNGVNCINKYTDFSDPPKEFSTVMRLAEVFLIRAEAKLRQDKLTEAAADIDIIRTRAGLDGTTSTTQADLMNDIIKERQLELFTEWGHRWLDLKRWNMADQVMQNIKGANWQSTDQLFPIPEMQILNDPTMKNSQNPGY